MRNLSAEKMLFSILFLSFCFVASLYVFKIGTFPKGYKIEGADLKKRVVNTKFVYDPENKRMCAEWRK